MSKYLYRAHRMDKARDGSTKHDFMPDPGDSAFSNIDDALNALKRLSERPPLCEKGKIALLEIILERPRTNYADGKLRTITVHGKKYKWQSDGRLVTVFDESGNALLQYTGDPHDCTPSGVKTAIREELLGRL